MAQDINKKEKIYILSGILANIAAKKRDDIIVDGVTMGREIAELDKRINFLCGMPTQSLDRLEKIKFQKEADIEELRDKYRFARNVVNDIIKWQRSVLSDVQIAKAAARNPLGLKLDKSRLGTHYEILDIRKQIKSNNETIDGLERYVSINRSCDPGDAREAEHEAEAYRSDVRVLEEKLAELTEKLRREQNSLLKMKFYPIKIK